VLNTIACLLKFDHGKEYVNKENFVSLPLLKLAAPLSLPANIHMGLLCFISRCQSSLFGSVAEPGPRAEEPNLNCLPEPEPKLRISALAPVPASSTVFTTDIKKFYRKNHGY
jgi:hypothetical protein